MCVQIMKNKKIHSLQIEFKNIIRYLLNIPLGDCEKIKVYQKENYFI